MHIRFGEFELDSRRFLLERSGEKISLRPKVFDLLIYLARHRERVVTREELVGELWGGTQVGAGSLSGLVNELRRSLAESGRGPSSIRTVHARGYQFVARVEPASELEPWSHGGGSDSKPRIDGWRSPGTSAIVEPGAGPEGPGAWVGAEDVIDRIRFDLGRVLRDGARGLIVEGGTVEARSAVLERAVSLACHLGFEGIRLACPEAGPAESAPLGRRLLEILAERRGLPAIRAASAGGLDEPFEGDFFSEEDADGVAAGARISKLARLLRCLALEQPILLAIDFDDRLDPSAVELFSAIASSRCRDAPILWLVGTDEPVEEDSAFASSAPIDEPARQRARQRGDLLALVQGGGIEVLRWVESQRTLLDRWLMVRGLEPLPEPLADAIVRHLAGHASAMEEVLERLAGEAELVGGDAIVAAVEPQMPSVPPSHRFMRSVRPSGRKRRESEEGAA